MDKIAYIISCIPQEERAEVIDLANASYLPIFNWLNHFPISENLSGRLAGGCLTHASMSPEMGLQVIIDHLQISYLYWLLDDLIDLPETDKESDSRKIAILDAIHSIVKAEGQLRTDFFKGLKLSAAFQEVIQKIGDTIDNNLNYSQLAPWEQVATMFAYCCRHVMTYPAAASYYQQFFVPRHALLIKMWKNQVEWVRKWQQEEAFIGYDEYVREYSETVVTPALGALWMSFFCQPHSVTSTDKELANELLTVFGIVTRLVNDISSLQRDLKEKNSMNALFIKMHADHCTEEEAKKIVLAEAMAYQKKAEALAKDLPNYLQYWGKCIMRGIYIMSNVYLSGEYSEFSKEMLEKLTDQK